MKCNDQLFFILERIKKKTRLTRKMNHEQGTLFMLPYVYNLAEFFTWDYVEKPADEWINLALVDKGKRTLEYFKVPERLTEKNDTFQKFFEEWSIANVRVNDINETMPTENENTKPHATCRRCGRDLSSEKSVFRGIGPICINK